MSQNPALVDKLYNSLAEDARKALEVSAISHLRKRSASEFAAADINSDGQISQKEFSKWLSKLQPTAMVAAGPPTRQQLINLSIQSAVPFIAFGFMDNFIMITAGDVIDQALGSAICEQPLYTLQNAYPSFDQAFLPWRWQGWETWCQMLLALAWYLSWLFGLLAIRHSNLLPLKGNSIEANARKLGLPDPKLTPEQVYAVRGSVHMLNYLTLGAFVDR